MLRIKKMRVTGYLACLLIVLMQLGPAGQALAAKAILAPAQRVVVFPFSVGEGVTQATLGKNASQTLTSMLRGKPGFDFGDYFRRHPSLQRAALVEGTLSEKELADPSGTANKDLAIKIGKEMGADKILIGDLESYRYDPAANTCELQITAQMVDVKSGVVDQTLVVTGQVPKTAKVSSESDCASVAAGDAVSKIAEGLQLKMSPGAQLAAAKQPVVASAPPRKKSKKNLLLSLILGLGIGLAMSGGGSSGTTSGGGIDSPPDVPGG